MSKINRKSIISFGAALLSVAPVAIAVSCGPGWFSGTGSITNPKDVNSNAKYTIQSNYDPDIVNSITVSGTTIITYMYRFSCSVQEAAEHIWKDRGYSGPIKVY